MTWNERLSTLARERGWGGAELERRSGVDRQLIYKYLRGEIAQPRGDILTRLAEALGTTEAYLRFGPAPPIKPGTPAELPVEIATIPVVILTKLYMFGGIDALFVDKDSLPRMAAPEAVGPRAFGVRLHDDSMAPDLPAGAVVIIDPDQPVTPGRPVAAIVHRPHGHAVVRIWRALDATDLQRGELVANNAFYPPIPVHSSEQATILGRAVYVIHSL